MSTILITGASAGLGAEMARQFAAKGHDLALCARRPTASRSSGPRSSPPHPGGRIEVRRPGRQRRRRRLRGRSAPSPADFGTIDKVVVNAGLGKGAKIGTGNYAANKETAMTNFVAALAQSEAAMEIFREQNAGHLVMVSSMSAMRGLPKPMATYAATKAGVAHLAEGLRNEFHGKPIKVTVLYPGYIASEMNDQVAEKTPLMVDTEKGVRAMVNAIEKEVADACVPPLPWSVLAPVMKYAPLPLFKKMV